LHTINEPARLEPEAMWQLSKGADEFNAGMFFECHETLEDLWHGIRGQARDFFQGLIQVAVGFYHLGNRNMTGCRSQLEKGLQKLIPYGDSYMGVDAATLRVQTEAWLDKVRSGEEIRAHVRDLPKIRFIVK